MSRTYKSYTLSRYEYSSKRLSKIGYPPVGRYWKTNTHRKERKHAKLEVRNNLNEQII